MIIYIDIKGIVEQKMQMLSFHFLTLMLLQPFLETFYLPIKKVQKYGLETTWRSEIDDRLFHFWQTLSITIQKLFSW